MRVSCSQQDIAAAIQFENSKYQARTIVTWSQDFKIEFLGFVQGVLPPSWPPSLAHCHFLPLLQLPSHEQRISRQKAFYCSPYCSELYERERELSEQVAMWWGGGGGGGRESNRRLFAVKSDARGRGVVIMVENDNEPRKEATKEAIPPGQSQKTKF